MSTRCMVAIKGELSPYNIIHFYRHSDGYPEGVAPSIKKYLEYVSRDLIRKNAEQSAGWLLIIGMQEYLGQYSHSNEKTLVKDITPTNAISGYKIGAYELATQFHSDIEYGYIVDISFGKVIQLTRDEYQSYMDSPSLYTESMDFGEDITDFILNYNDEV